VVEGQGFDRQFAKTKRTKADNGIIVWNSSHDFKLDPEAVASAKVRLTYKVDRHGAGSDIADVAAVSLSSLTSGHEHESEEFALSRKDGKTNTVKGKVRFFVQNSYANEQDGLASTGTSVPAQSQEKTLDDSTAFSDTSLQSSLAGKSAEPPLPESAIPGPPLPAPSKEDTKTNFPEVSVISMATPGIHSPVPNAATSISTFGTPQQAPPHSLLEPSVDTHLSPNPPIALPQNRAPVQQEIQEAAPIEKVDKAETGVQCEIQSPPPDPSQPNGENETTASSTEASPNKSGLSSQDKNNLLQAIDDLRFAIQSSLVDWEQRERTLNKASKMMPKLCRLVRQLLLAESAKERENQNQSMGGSFNVSPSKLPTGLLLKVLRLLKDLCMMSKACADALKADDTIATTLISIVKPSGPWSNTTNSTEVEEWRVMASELLALFALDGESNAANQAIVEVLRSVKSRCHFPDLRIICHPGLRAPTGLSCGLQGPSGRRV